MGPALIVLALVVVIPVSVFISGGVVAAIIGYFTVEEADRRADGSELVGLNS